MYVRACVCVMKSICKDWGWVCAKKKKKEQKKKNASAMTETVSGATFFLLSVIYNQYFNNAKMYLNLYIYRFSKKKKKTMCSLV